MRNWLNIVVGVGAFTVAGALMQGCDELGEQGCTEIGCSDAVTMVFEPPLTEEGAYDFEFRTARGVVTCTGAVPLEAGRLVCTTSEVVREALTAGGGIAELTWHQSPEAVEIVVWRDGTEIRRAPFYPDYATLYPNGKECDADWGGCQQATVQVTP